MALYAQFSGTVKDASGSNVNNFRYRGYHKETNKWSDWYLSNGIAQYNINLGDASWLSQSGTINSGEHVLIVVETLESNPIERKFAMFETIIIGTISTYLQPVQIKANQPIVLKNKWKLQSPTDNFTTEGIAQDYVALIYVGRVNERITAIATFEDEYSWVYNGKTFRHVSSYYNQDIFSDRLGIVSTLYDWNENLFIDTTYRSFASCSAGALNDVFPIRVRVTTVSGLITDDLLCLRVKYNKPTLVLTYTPDEPNINTPLQIFSQIEDPDNVREIITYYFNDTQVSQNNLLTHSWSQTLGSSFITELVIAATLEWSDGFVDSIFTTEIRIAMSNIPPDFSLIKLVGVNDQTYTRLIVNNPIDIDGDISKLRVKWLIEYMTPIDNAYKVVYSTDYPLLPNALSKEILLNTSGKYRATASVIDQYGAETVKDIEFVISESTTTPTSVTMTPLEWGY